MAGKRLIGDQRLICAARLGRGDVQQTIADKLGVSNETVSRLCMKLKMIDPECFSHYGRRQKLDRPDPATLAAPVSLDDPSDRVRAFITGPASPHSRRSYATDIEDARKRLGLASTTDLLKIDTAHVLRYREAMVANGYAGSTIRRRLTALFLLIDRDIRLGYRNGPNPADSLLVKRPRGEARSTLDVLSPDEVQRLLAVCDADTRPKGYRDSAMARVSLWLGLRVGELCGMTAARPDDWRTRREGGWFTLEGDTMKLVIVGKGEKSRTLVVQSEVRDSIDRYLKVTGRDWSACDPLFRQRADKPAGIGTRGWRRVLQDRCKQAGIDKNISAHSTRKTAASQLLDQGVDLEKLRRFLGHSVLSVTQRYLTMDGDGGAAAAMDYTVAKVG